MITFKGVSVKLREKGKLFTFENERDTEHAGSNWFLNWFCDKWSSSNQGLTSLVIFNIPQRKMPFKRLVTNFFPTITDLVRYYFAI